MADLFSRDDVFAVCDALPATRNENPFGPETCVYKVVGKVFVIMNLDGEPVTVTLKADPPHAEALVRDHPWITPGYHMNKRHWVTVTIRPDADPQLVTDLIVNSYERVVEGLPRAKRPT